MVHAPSNAQATPDSEESPDEFEQLLRVYEKCSQCAEPLYETLSKSQLRSYIWPKDGKNALFQPPYQLSPKEDVELHHTLEKAL